jgi:two-component system, sensor histidine kinase
MPKNSFVERRLGRLSIAQKLGLMIAILSLVVCGLFSVSLFGMRMLAAIRAYVGGEGLWSKAQKQAVFRLNRYVDSADETDYQRFVTYLDVPLGDRRAREELEKPNPDEGVVYEGFVRGGIHPNDIGNMIFLFRRFRNLRMMDQSVRIWTRGDQLINDLLTVGDEIHRLMRTKRLDREKIDRLLTRTESLNESLTALENAFSTTLSHAARWIQFVLLCALIGTTVGFLGIGLLVAFLISRNLNDQIRRLRDRALAVADGREEMVVAVTSQDELGELAGVLQRTMAQRQAAEAQVRRLNVELERRVEQLGAANRDLEGFSYSVSHDLRAPLRAIDGFSKILEEDHAEALNGEARRLLGVVRRNVAQMSALIDGLLSFSRLTLRPLETEPVSMNDMAREVFDELVDDARRATMSLTLGALGTVEADRTLIRQVWANLLGNAIKFTRGRSPAVIEVERKDAPREAIFSVRDNGAGFDMAYADKLFGVFQRLHRMEEFEGTGVGLALVQRIIQRHGGRVWAEGRVGEGAVFYFSLPFDV